MQASYVIELIHQINSPQIILIQFRSDQKVGIVERRRLDKLWPYTIYQPVFYFFNDRPVTVRNLLQHTGCSFTRLSRIEQNQTTGTCHSVMS